MSSTDLELVDSEREIQGIDQSALANITRGEIDVQIATAKRWPRSITNFKRKSMELACLDEDTAASMYYVIPRDGKKIEGPSVRMAEIVGSSWGNLRYGSRVVEIGDKFLTAQGACHDLETNNAITVEVRRRITGKTGKRYSDDMIQVTANAACSIALRQAIFKIVPFALVKDIYQAAREVSVGKAETIGAKRDKSLEWFKKAGADEADVLAFLGHKSVDDITIDDLITLRGLATAIRDGEISIEEALRPQKGDEGKVRPSELNEKVAAKSQQAAPARTSKFDINVAIKLMEACATMDELDSVCERNNVTAHEAGIDWTEDECRLLSECRDRMEAAIKAGAKKKTKARQADLLPDAPSGSDTYAQG